MAAPTSHIQWYLARDGKQFGPLSEAELAKFIELGHLLPTDLLWREGFAEWRPAPSVFPPKAASPAPPRPAAPQQRPAAALQTAGAQQTATQVRPQQPLAAPRAQAAATQQRQPVRMQPAAAARPVQQQPLRAAAPAQAQLQSPVQEDVDDDADFEPGGRVLRRAITAVVVLSLIGGAGYFGYVNRGRLIALAGLGAAKTNTSAAITVNDRRSLEIPPFKGLTGTRVEIDTNMQQAALWQVLKREFPEWYEERLKQATELSARQAPNAEVAQQIAQSLVQLRRQQLNNALSASVPRLKLVASSFFENLVQLRKSSDIACFEFIARGEASPLLVTMLQGSPNVPNLQAQMTAVYEAIADGRKTPRAYPQPRKEDYEALAADLTKERGWTQADLQLFTDERALSQAPPGKICQLVHDWFAAQLDLKDPDMQVRLLVDSLKPVVAG